MSSELASLERRATAELAACADEAALRTWNTKYFGKQGEMVTALKAVSAVPPAERRAYGQEANRIKDALTQAYDAALAHVKELALEASLRAAPLDVTLPGRSV